MKIEMKRRHCELFLQEKKKNYYRQQIAHQSSLHIVSRETINLVIRTHRTCHPKNTGASHTPTRFLHLFY
jgi:hypothetical protein